MEDNRHNHEDDLQFNNELERIKLKLEFGMDFQSEEKSELPPEVEQQFLKNVRDYESNHLVEQVTIYEYIGKPDFRKAEELSDEELPDQIIRINELFEQHNIKFGAIYPPDPRKLYKFLTEELFFVKTDNFKIPDWSINYIYEEFYPNHKADLLSHSKDFITGFLDKEENYFNIFVYDHTRAIKKMLKWRENQAMFFLNHLNFVSLEYNEEKGSVVYDLEFIAVPNDKSKPNEYYSGKCTIHLIYDYEFWCVQRAVFPKVIN